VHLAYVIIVAIIVCPMLCKQHWTEHKIVCRVRSPVSGGNHQDCDVIYGPISTKFGT